MAKLSYASVIEHDRRYKMLADLGLRMDEVDAVRLLPRLVDLVAPEHLALLAEGRSILGADGYWLAESDQTRRKLIKGAYQLHRMKGTPWAIREIVRRPVSEKSKSSKAWVIRNTTAKSDGTEPTRTDSQTTGHITVSP